PGVDLLDLRLYVVVQATLFFSLILSGAFALFSHSPRKTLFVLGSGAFLHLFLDAFQVKWANGVHFFAPFDWRLTQFALFWPESLPTYVVTVLGLSYMLFHWRKSSRLSWPIHLQSKRYFCAAVVLLLVYLILPLAFLKASEARDNHFVKTLREVAARPGKLIEFDRAFYRYENNKAGGKLISFGGEVFDVKGLTLNDSSNISIRGVFIDSNTVQVQAYHLHPSYFRDNASYVGLAFITFLWGLSGFSAWTAWKRRRKHGRQAL
ncbi:MAG: hypothetical protein ACE5F7_03495, partial [Nitrospiria bacterium]